MILKDPNRKVRGKRGDIHHGSGLGIVRAPTA